MPDKKDRELAVLSDVLGFCQQAGRYRKKAAAKLSGQLDSSWERPDLVIGRHNGAVIGLEHFRVDHHVTKGRKAKSKAARLCSDLEKRRQRIAAEIPKDPDALDEAAAVIARGFKASMENHEHATVDHLAFSLDKRLFGEGTGHAMKMTEYRENLKGHYDGAEQVELGYLIECHSDLRGLFLNNDRGVSCLEAGLCPLTPEMHGLLSKASEDVDWILIGFYPCLGLEIVDAAVIDCRHGMFGESCRRQGLEPTEYLGACHGDAHYRRATKDVQVKTVGNSYELQVEGDVSADGAAMLGKSIIGATRAIELGRSARPFVATILVQMLYEALWPVSRRVRGEVTVDRVSELMVSLPAGELTRRLEAFGPRYGMEDR